MKHAILGAGAIGGLIGTALGSLGENVRVVARTETLSTYPRTLRVERLASSSTLSSSIGVVDALTDEVDVLWTAICRLNVAASGERLLGAIIAKLQSLGFTCQFIANERTLLWSKLCFLASFALVTSASTMNIGDILAEAVWKQKLHAAVDEACAVARAEGAEIDTAAIQRLYSGMLPGMRSSMQKDLAAGRRIELDAIGGPVVRLGELHGIDVSTTRELVAEISVKERERA